MMKTKIILVILVSLLFNCSNPTIESEFLTDDQLVNVLRNDKDFNDFIEEKAIALSEMKDRLNNLDQYSKGRINVIYQKYKDQDDFLNNSTIEEQRFMTSIAQSQSTQSLSTILEKNVGRSLFNKKALINFISDELRKAIIAKAASKKDYKIAVDCKEIGLNAYIEALNRYYYNVGWDIETADKYAQMAGDWAEWGCFKALMY